MGQNKFLVHFLGFLFRSEEPPRPLPVSAILHMEAADFPRQFHANKRQVEKQKILLRSINDTFLTLAAIWDPFDSSLHCGVTLGRNWILRPYIT